MVPSICPRKSGRGLKVWPVPADGISMETRVERVVLETPRHRITGDLHLPREGYRSRLSDFLNRGDLEFIPLVNAEISSANGGATESRSFLAVASGHVQLAYPYEEAR
jgi:hypothetical protein